VFVHYLLAVSVLNSKLYSVLQVKVCMYLCIYEIHNSSVTNICIKYHIFVHNCSHIAMSWVLLSESALTH